MTISGSTIILSRIRQREIEDLFIRMQYKLRSSLKNKGRFLLGIDILRDSVKRDLLKFIMLNIETTLLNLIKNDFTGFDEKAVLLRLVKISSEDFLRAQYGSRLTIDSGIIARSSYFQLLSENSNIVLRLPFLTLLNLDTKIFHSIFYPTYTVASDKFLEILFDNLLIEISNCIVSLMITEFSGVDTIRQTLCKSRFLSPRNLDRFKNSLIWQIQLKRYVTFPKNLYNSQYGIWRIRSKNIYYRIIYANRSNQLVRLSAQSLLTVTVIETFDFAVSRIVDLIYLFGNTIEVAIGTAFGKFIGVVWRGIMEGVKK